MALYFRQLKPDGVLAVHISNKYLNLQPVFLSAAEWLGKSAVAIDSKSEEQNAVYRAVWVLVSSRQNFFSEVEIRELAKPLDNRPGPPVGAKRHNILVAEGGRTPAIAKNSSFGLGRTFDQNSG